MRKFKAICLFLLITTLFLGCDFFGNEESEESNIDDITELPEEITTTLTIKNQSFSDLMSVVWNGIEFELNSSIQDIEIGNYVTKDVSAGTSYIYFKRKSNPVFVRTKAAITVNSGENIEFTFTDNTLVIEQNNSSNTGTLSGINSTVVFWDDAEGELQRYETFPGSYCYSSNAKSGINVISFGSDGCIILELELEKAAKFSFFRYLFSIISFSIYINDQEIKTWEYDSCNWSYFEASLDAGFVTIKLQINTYPDSSFAFLDDLLVVYTE